MPNLFLSGWWNQIQSQVFDDIYRNTLQGKHILYIPRAMYPERFDSCLEWMEQVFPPSDGYKISLLSIKDYNATLLHDCDGIYIWWGNTFRLLHLLRTTGYDRLIEDFIKNNKPIYWGSAWAIICWHNINTAPDMNITKLQYSQTLGFNQVWWYSIACHYDGKQSTDLEIMEYINYYDSPIIALPEWVGCYLHNHKLIVWWSWSASVFTSQGKQNITSGHEIMI